MKYLFFSFVIAFFIFGKCISCFTKKETDLVISFFEPLEISSCVFVKKSCPQLSQIANVSKIFSSNNSYFIYFDLKDFLYYFEKGKIPQRRTMIILKADDNVDAYGIAAGLTVPLKKYCSWFVWIMILPQNMKKFTEKNLQIPFDCQFIIAQESDSSFELNEIFQVKDSAEIIYTKLPDSEIKTQCCSAVVDKYTNGRRRIYLSGMKMIARFTPNEYCAIKETCVAHNLWFDMEKSFNFTTTKMTGRELKKKKPKQRFDVEDFFKPFHAMNPNTKDMIGPVHYGIIKAYMRFESDNEHYWGSYLRPFEFDMWATLSVWLILSTIIITITATIMKYFLPKKFAVLDHAFIACTAIAYQGGFDNLSIISYRIEVLSALLTASVIVPAYSAAVISYLTVIRPIIPFTTLEGLVKDGTYKIAAVQHPFVPFIFDSYNDPIFMTIKSKHLLPLDEFPPDGSSMIQMLCKKENRILVLDPGENFRGISFPCHIIKIVTSAVTFTSGIELQANSPYKSILNEIVFNAKKSGLIGIVMQREWAEPDLTIRFEEFRPIDLQMTSSIFILITIGVIFAVAILILEISWNFLKIWRKNKRVSRKIQEQQPAIAASSKAVSPNTFNSFKNSHNLNPKGSISPHQQF